MANTYSPEFLALVAIPIPWREHRREMAAGHNPMTCKACVAYCGRDVQFGAKHPDLSVRRIEGSI